MEYLGPPAVEPGVSPSNECQGKTCLSVAPEQANRWIAVDMCATPSWPFMARTMSESNMPSSRPLQLLALTVWALALTARAGPSGAAKGNVEAPSGTSISSTAPVQSAKPD